MKIPAVLFCTFLLLAFLSPVAAIGGDEGWIEVRCNVDGASVSFDDTYKGTITSGVLTVPVYTTAKPFRTVYVERAGYYPWSGLVTMPSPGQTTTIYATLNPVPVPVQYGTIYVESTPAGAEISFNGDYRGLSPLTISDVWPGTYTITAEKSGYHTYSATTSVSSGTRSSVYCPLSPLTTTGSLYVLSTPSNANIYLDAVYKGRTPMTISNIAAGTHILEVDTSGYYDWKSTVDVPPGGTKTISATLNPMPTATTGWVYVASSPGGASVTLDGSPVGQTPYSGSLKLNGIAAGDHTVGLSLAGYAPYSAKVSVSPNTVSEVSAILQPSAPVSTTGSLSISSTPAGANVFVDNNFIGITPLTTSSVTTGTHTVTIRMDGYQEYSVSTPVNAGATSTVSAALLPVTPAPSSDIPVFLGILALGLAGIFVSRKNR
ncbi:MAG: PEGA domain-containing protein [Methanomicrobiales archaeon]|nr:PEGA domain-containing protein [Methanomicrobiales archaeon]